MRHFAPLFALLLGFAPPPARADIFDSIEAHRFGSLTDAESACARAPHHIRFSPDHRRATFTWAAEITTYLGTQAHEAGYTVLAHDETSITLRLDDEQRRTQAGDPVVWVLLQITRPEGYCWGRTDWPAGRCVGTHIQCDRPAPIS